MADRSFKMGATIVVLFVIPMWMNFLLRTVAWMSLLEDSGLINSLLKSLGFGKVQLMYNSQAVLLGMIYNFLPFMVFPIYNALNKQDQCWSEAAMDLGANKWTTFWKVTFPISMPGIISGITMVFMPSMTTFFIPRVLGGGNTEMFGDLIERTFLFADDWNVGSALSLIMMMLTNIPMTMPDIVTGISLMLLFIFSRVERGYFTMLLAHITFDTPYVVLSVLPKLRQMNRYSYEAALDLGATPGYAMRRVILPAIRPGIITGTLLAFTLSLDDFTISYFTTSPLVQNLSTLIYSEARKGIKPTMNALSALVFVALLILLVTVNHRTSRTTN